VQDLPTQLPWRRFVCILHRLGYVPQRAGRGSMRVFVSTTREPHTVSFREPHPGDTMRPGILRKNVRKLMLEPDEFMEPLTKC
jgi:predicted RNA binding protein YcfA (HicA-like mRNA interferase family)